MNELARFKGPSGDEMVILPAADFERLVAAAEDAGDRAAYDSAMLALSKGEEEPVPAAVVTRLLEGEHPIKVWREHRGMTVSALASRVGINQGFLSQIENGRRSGTIGTLNRIAAALRVELVDIAVDGEDAATAMLAFLRDAGPSSYQQIASGLRGHGSTEIGAAYRALLIANRIAVEGQTPGRARMVHLVDQSAA